MAACANGGRMLHRCSGRLRFRGGAVPVSTVALRVGYEDGLGRVPVASLSVAPSWLIRHPWRTSASSAASNAPRGCLWTSSYGQSPCNKQQCVGSSQSCIHTASNAQLLMSTRWSGHFKTLEDARVFVVSLPASQRKHLEKAIAEATEEKEGKREKVTPPTWHQLRLLCYQHTLPFIGFGFLDNFIMITVGEYIDLTIGAMLTISTMAAAGCGNLISDLAGLGLADQVEALCKLFGVPNPNLSSAQLQHRAARWMALLGRCLGIIIGCTLGMAPLLWFQDPHHPPPKDTTTTDS